MNGLLVKKEKEEESKKNRTNRKASPHFAEKPKKTRSSGCGQPQAGSAFNEVLKLNFNDLDYNMCQLNQRSQIIS